jgi:hypothetical protein
MPLLSAGLFAALIIQKKNRTQQNK